MTIKIIHSKPFLDQKPGTSGLRKKVKIFQMPHYTENFIQAIFNVINPFEKTLILGGDGRFYMQEVLQIIIKMAVAHKVGHLLIGQNGLLSTPAVSHLIRKYKAFGGIILSASHNLGGENGDFGIKYNMANGGSALEHLTEAFYQQTRLIDQYKLYQMPDIDLSQKGSFIIDKTEITIIDSVKDYADFMEEIFDFSLIKKAQREGLTFQFDAMHAVTGPYAKEIFIKRLGFPETSIWHAESLPDFGGGAPDPNLSHMAEFQALQSGIDAVDLAAASDGDGDRNLIFGRHQYVTPGDSLAILVDYAQLLPFYASTSLGVARSMPTSRAIDAVTKAKNIPLYETPTGWKFFGNLLDAGNIVFCGEESYGTGSFHIREKDGLWAILFWLNLLACTKKSVAEIVKTHWQIYGRFYVMRYDYENLDEQKALLFIKDLYQKIDQCSGKKFENYHITKADDFCYTDPTDKSISSNQGVRVFLKEGNSRIVYRLSGTGTRGATLRIYIETFENDPTKQADNAHERLKDLAEFAKKFAILSKWFGAKDPDMIV